MNVNKLHDVILDHSDSPVEQLVAAMEKELSLLLPFNHAKDDIQEAFGINLKNRDQSFTKELAKTTRVSERAQILEQNFTKREIVFMFLRLQADLGTLNSLQKLMEKLQQLRDLAKDDE